MTDAHEIIAAGQARPNETHAALSQSLRSAEEEYGAAPVSLAAVLLRRWRTMLLVSTILGVTCSSAIWYLVRPKSGATVVLHVAPVVQPVLFTDGETDISRLYQQYIATESHVIRSPAVILATLNAPDVRELPTVTDAENPARGILANLEVRQVSGTRLVEVTLVGERAEDIAIIVNRLVQAYLSLREKQKLDADQRTLRSLRTERATLEARLAGTDAILRRLAVEDGLGTAEGAEASLHAWIAEIQRLLSEANIAKALASAKLSTLDSNGEASDPSQADPTGFEEFLQNDRQWQTIKDELRLAETAALNDQRLGRGTAHPDVVGRPERIALLRQEISDREAKLRESYKGSLRRRLEAEQLSAEITTKTHEGRLAELTAKRADVANQVFQIEGVRHDREKLEKSLAVVQEKIWHVELEQNRAPRVTIVSSARAPETPNIDKRLKYSAAACVMSLFMGVACALLRHRLDRSLREPEEVTDRLGLALLGSVHRVPNTNGASLLSGPSILEPLRGISTALLASCHPAQNHSLLITSPTAQSGKSSMATNLARSLASTGRRVLLVDADNRGQGVTRAFRMEKQRGLKELLEGASKPERVVRASDLENLQILPAGQRSEQFGEFLVRRDSQEAFRSLFTGFDQIVVDSPPVLAGSDAVILATLVDEVVLVVRAGKSTHEEVHAARRCLSGVGGRLVGVILNAVDSRRSPYSYSQYAHVDGKGESQT